jgi:hypothetical protein
MKKTYLVLCMNIVLQIMLPAFVIALFEIKSFLAFMITFIHAYAFRVSMMHFNRNIILYKINKFISSSEFRGER